VKKGEDNIMKSLIRKAQCNACATETVETQLPVSTANGEEAQCCAKVSKNVAGCHD
jgi:hypothetical protein